MMHSKSTGSANVPLERPPATRESAKAEMRRLSAEDYTAAMTELLAEDRAAAAAAAAEEEEDSSEEEEEEPEEEKKGNLKPINPFFALLIAANKSKAKSFEYNGRTYYRKHKDDNPNLVYYKAEY